jgi:hypothetical protein
MEQRIKRRDGEETECIFAIEVDTGTYEWIYRIEHISDGGRRR